MKSDFFAPSAYIGRYLQFFFYTVGIIQSRTIRIFFASADLRKDVVTIWSAAILNHSCHSAVVVMAT